MWISGLGKIFITWTRGPGPSRVNLMRISHEYSYPALTLSVNTSDGDLIADHGPVSPCPSGPGPCPPCSHLSPGSPRVTLSTLTRAPPNIILNYPLTGLFSLLSSETLLGRTLKMFSVVLGGGLNSLNIHQSLSPDRELSKANLNKVCGVVNCNECSHAFNPRISAPAGFPSPISPLLSTARRNGHLHRY